MNSKRVFYIMLGLVVLLGLGVIGATYGANGILQKKASELTELRLQNQVIDIQQTSVGQAKKDIEKYSELETIAKSVVPQEKDQAKTVREIINIAEESGINIERIAFPASNLGQKQAAAKPTTDSTESDDSSETKATPAAPLLSQVTPVSGINGVFQLSITVETPSTPPSVTYAQLNRFLERLEQNRRTSQVSGITVRPKQTSRSNSLLSFTLDLTVYIKP